MGSQRVSNVYQIARESWIKRQREIFVAQLQLLETGSADPFDGAADHLVFANSQAARRTLEEWIAEIDTKLGFDHAQGS